LNSAFRNPRLKVAENLLYEIYGRGRKPIPELVSERIRSARGSVSLEEEAKDLFNKQRIVALVANLVNKVGKADRMFF